MEDKMSANTVFPGIIGFIEVVCGGMFSGKSEAVSAIISRHKHSKTRDVVTFSPILARRTIQCEDGTLVDTTGKQASRCGSSHTAIEVSEKNPYQIIDIIQEFLATGRKVTTVIIEEGHFFSPDLVSVCTTLAEEFQMHVVVGGLDQDFFGRPFGPMPALMAEAEFIHKEHAVCDECGSLVASKSWLDTRELSKADGNVLVGDRHYMALCRHCRRLYVEKYGLPKVP